MAERIDPERMRTYLRSLDRDLPAWLHAVENECAEMYVPVIRQETRSLLRMLLAAMRPAHILEVGTAIGFSSLIMAEHSDAEILTIEHAPQRVEAARENIANSPHAGRIRLIAGDAEEVLGGITETFPFIFMDAAKGQYIHFLPRVRELLGEGGVLVTDNVLRGGDILEPHYAVERRNRTIHKRMREYLYALTHDDELVTDILEDGDGIAVSVKRQMQRRTVRNEV